MTTILTFQQLFTLYYDRHALPRTRCPQNARYFFSAHGHKFASREITTISQIEIQNWIDELGACSPSTATRAVNMMSAIYNWGIRRHHIPNHNPCQGVERFKTKSRERFLLPAELERFRSALLRQPADTRDFFSICLMTGARKGNVLAMSWDEIDLDLAIWSFNQKNGETHTLPLCEAAVNILKQRLQSNQSTKWVFPGRVPGQHLIEPKRAWKRLLEAANISDLRIHDLRRTLGSYLAIQGESQYIIGKALGHKDVRSTSVYARLNLEPIRRASETAVGRMFGNG